ncbi:MAG: hypothetical protein J07HQW1_01269 [Haloquadratum walsbyi J07HQW1]|jgi:uncharacterized protein (DUF433 family)|uniref:Uncharacterized protein n=1 Tax=Haloquadratum walsbyi J07HQW1 TaxID=1238424 RepID=U1PGH5_9EURY|nr:MAG: hypothetical protein J07HQW1_01269 [Haloquadratum walsbyi J07HQW1]
MMRRHLGILTVVGTVISVSEVAAERATGAFQVKSL